MDESGSSRLSTSYPAKHPGKSRTNRLRVVLLNEIEASGDVYHQIKEFGEVGSSEGESFLQGQEEEEAYANDPNLRSVDAHLASSDRNVRDNEDAAREDNVFIRIYNDDV